MGVECTHIRSLSLSYLILSSLLFSSLFYSHSLSPFPSFLSEPICLFEETTRKMPLLFPFFDIASDMALYKGIDRRAESAVFFFIHMVPESRGEHAAMLRVGKRGAGAG